MRSMNDVSKRLNVFAWTLSATGASLAVLAWGQGLKWQLEDLSLYEIFPVFGLVAFSLMWSHYVVAAFRLYFRVERPAIVKYFHATSLIVLAAILTHPGLLIWQLWQDNFGLPPGSVKQTYGWIAILGMISLLVFLAFELHRWFDKRSWWWYIERANDMAMVAIYYHGLSLGTHLQSGWLRYTWYFYGATLVAALVYIYYKKSKPQSK